MNNSELKQLWTKAHSYACRRGHHSIADDFAQEACIAWHRGREAGVEHLLIDFLRAEYGSTGSRRSVTGLNRKIQRFKEVSIDKLVGDTGRTLGDSLAADQGDTGSIRDDRRLGVGIDGRAAEVCELVEQGYSQKEVADILGFTESRACQLMKSAKKKIEAEAIVRERYDTYKDFKESSLLMIDWIAI